MITALIDNEIRPIDAFDWVDSSKDEKIRLKSIGYQAIANSKVAAVILSGGQGTRLGFNGPKGMYDIGLPSHKSIFQLHIEKIKKIKELVISNYPDISNVSIPIYVMTSDLNDQIIKDFFISNNYFNYPKDDIYFFEQGLQICVTFDYEVILESSTKLAMSPDGNGGIYPALLSSGAIDDMINRKIEYLHVYGIDNVLTKSIDPAFIGVCIDKQVEVGNKVVWRNSINEKVGTTVTVNDRITVLEYSEIPSQLVDKIDSQSGRFVYGAANICNHFMTLKFITNKVLTNLSSSYHIAKKKIPYYDLNTNTTIIPPTNNGMKLELFIFDVFPLADSYLVMNVDRFDEFAPVKNEPGNASDSPDTARYLLSKQSIKWLNQIGAIITNENDINNDNVISIDGLQCEISPLLSYDGEGLESFHNKSIQLPSYLDRQINEIIN
eukprot:gene19600-25504_t